MTVTIELKPEIEAILQKRAAAQGCDVAGYVEGLIEKAVRSPRTFDEILAPFREEVAESGMSDDELDQLFTNARRQVSQARRGSRAR